MFFCAFKSALRISTHQHYTMKIKANMKVFIRRRNKIAEKIVAEGDGYVGRWPESWWLELFKDRYAASNAHIITAFTKEKVSEAHQMYVVTFFKKWRRQAGNETLAFKQNQYHFLSILWWSDLPNNRKSPCFTFNVFSQIRRNSSRTCPMIWPTLPRPPSSPNHH